MKWSSRLVESLGHEVIVAARKLAVLLHRLWVSGETYQPLRVADAEALAA